MSTPTHLVSLVKNSSEEIRVCRDNFKGHDLVDIRVFGRFGGSAAVMRPTKKGVAIQVSQLAGLIDALQQALAKIEEGQ